MPGSHVLSECGIDRARDLALAVGDGGFEGLGLQLVAAVEGVTERSHAGVEVVHVALQAGEDQGVAAGVGLELVDVLAEVRLPGVGVDDLLGDRGLLRLEVVQSSPCRDVRDQHCCSG